MLVCAIISFVPLKTAPTLSTCPHDRQNPATPRRPAPPKRPPCAPIPQFRTALDMSPSPPPYLCPLSFPTAPKIESRPARRPRSETPAPPPVQNLAALRRPFPSLRHTILR